MKITPDTIYNCDCCSRTETDANKIKNWLVLKTLREEVFPPEYLKIGDKWERHFCSTKCLEEWVARSI